VAARAAFAAAQRAATNAAQAQAVTTAGQGFDSWMATLHNEFATYEAGSTEAAIAASLGQDRDIRKTYEQSLGTAQELGASSIQSATSSDATASTRSVWILFGCLALALALGSAVVYWLLRSVMIPLANVARLLTS
jgi:methyl-accepting chemotaxis protein